MEIVMKPFFSIIIVCLNPGEKLFETLASVQKQTFQDYEIVIKDGLSTDGSIERLEAQRMDQKIQLYREQDKSIYDAMNQAVRYCRGEFLFFLNCGDAFYDEEVLQKTADFITQTRQLEHKNYDIVYGNSYNQKTEAEVASAPKINGFTCYRNVPCHQTCFYAAHLFENRGYNPKYRVRGDYEHFLWCYYEQKAEIAAMPFIVSFYEGGGFSETKENRARSRQEHEEITKLYMKPAERMKYKLILLLTLAPLRRKIAENPRLSGLYNAMKSMIYRRKR